MKRGIVVGEVWASRRVAGLSGRSLKLVAITDAAEASEPSLASFAWASLTVAVDTLDARVGQAALCAYGSGARNVLLPGPDNRHLLCDAAIALLVDGDPASSGAAPAPPERPPQPAKAD